MPAVVILATEDSELAEKWERQLPPGRVVVRYPGSGTTVRSWQGTSAVLIADIASFSTLPQSLLEIPSVLVGEPMSEDFEGARHIKHIRYSLSYDDSSRNLQSVFPLVEEIAEKDAVLKLLRERLLRTDRVTPAQRGFGDDAADMWEFLETAIESMDVRDRLIAEFRRASRHLLRASHVVFFLRESDGFRADRGTSFFSSEDPMVKFLECHPTVIDGASWDVKMDLEAEVAVRNRLALWGSRLLVPVHDNGRLLGLIALGVRNDGQPYDDLDRARAVFFARLLRNLILKAGHFNRLSQIASQIAIGAKYLPGNIILNHDEQAPKHLPVVVRDLVGQVRRTRDLCRAVPCVGQPFRASAGMIAETGGIWAYWEEASSEVLDTLARERTDRREILRELSLTLSHELGNALVSLVTFRQLGSGRQMPSSLVETIKRDILQLEKLNGNLGMMQNLHEAETENADLREIIKSVAEPIGVKVDIGPEPITIRCFKRHLVYAFHSFFTIIGENRKELGLSDIGVKIRATGTGSETTALLAIRGKNLELEGVLPEYSADDVPTQGRLSIFLAKEILRMHNGEIHSGPGLESVEIMVSIRGT